MKTYTKYIRVRSCVSCKTDLTDDEIHFSKGCCPHCGHIEKFAGTIVATRTRSAKIEVTEYPLWQFWKKDVFVEVK